MSDSVAFLNPVSWVWELGLTMVITHAIVTIQCKSVMLQHEDSLSWMSWTSCHCYYTDMNTLITASYSWLVWYKVQYTMPWSDKYAWNLTTNETRQNHCKHSWCNQHNLNSPNSLAILVCIWIVSQWVGGLKLGIVVVYVCGKQFPVYFNNPSVSVWSQTSSFFGCCSVSNTSS